MKFMKLIAAGFALTFIIFSVVFGIYALFIYEPIYIPYINNFGVVSLDKIVVYKKAYETDPAFLIGVFSFLAGFLASIIIDAKTEFINPIYNYTVKLISKDMIMHSGVSKSSSGIFVRYEFVFEDENGDRKKILGNEELYFFLMEDNIVNIDVKKNRVLKFELLSVDGDF